MDEDMQSFSLLFSFTEDNYVSYNPFTADREQKKKPLEHPRGNN